MSTYYQCDGAHSYDRRHQYFTKRTLSETLLALDVEALTGHAESQQRPPRLLDVACPRRSPDPGRLHMAFAFFFVGDLDTTGSLGRCRVSSPLHSCSSSLPLRTGWTLHCTRSYLCHRLALVWLGDLIVSSNEKNVL